MWSIWDYVVDKFKSENTDKVRKKINKGCLWTPKLHKSFSVFFFSLRWDKTAREWAAVGYFSSSGQLGFDNTQTG